MILQVATIYCRSNIHYTYYKNEVRIHIWHAVRFIEVNVDINFKKQTLVTNNVATLNYIHKFRFVEQHYKV